MDYMGDIIKQIFNSFDFALMFIINVLSYLIIRLVYSINKGKYVNTWSKRLILMACTVVMGVIYKLGGYIDNVIIIYSCIMAPVFWDWILRPILKKLNIDYRQFEKYDDSVDTVIETKDTTITVESKKE